MLTFTKRQGVSGGSEVVQIQTASANGGYTPLVNKYTGTEALSCVLWPGDDQVMTTTLSATWSDAPNGKVSIAFPLATMTTLDVTWYDAMLKLADGSADLAAFRLEVTAGPGTAVAGKVYHTYKDLTDELPFVRKLADHLNDQSGFREIAAESRQWVDAAILRATPPIYYGLNVMQSYGEGSPGSLTYAGWYDPYGSLGLSDDPIIAAALDADQLVLTTSTGRRFVKASVYKTLSVILRHAVGMQTTNDLMAMSKDYADMAERTLRSCVAHIDTNGDGYPEYVITLNRTRLRRA